MEADDAPRLGGYRLLLELGYDATSVSYLAVPSGVTRADALVVVKELRPEAREERGLVAAFEEHGRRAARLTNGHFLRVIEVAPALPRPYIVLEYREGPSLHALLARARQRRVPIPLQAHLRIVSDLLSALEFAHAPHGAVGKPARFVHGEVEPHNLIVTFTGETKLAAFTMSAATTADLETRPDSLSGRFAYVSPEQVTTADVDPRADLFAAGAVLWECLLGSSPWAGKSDLAILEGLWSGRTPHLTDAAPVRIDPALAAILERAMARDPGNRYPTARAMRDDLERYAAVQRLSTRAETPASQPTVRGALGRLVSDLFAAEHDRLAQQLEVYVPQRHSHHPPVHAQSVVPCAPPEVAMKGSTPPTVVAARILAKWLRGVREGALAKAARKGVAAGIVVVLACASWLVLRSVRAPAGRSPPPTSTVVAFSTAGSPSSSPAPPPTAPAWVHIVVRVLPAIASVSVDGVPVANPFIVDRERNLDAHSMRAEASGYAAATRVLVFDADTEVTIHLAQSAPTASARRRRPPVATSGPPPAQPIKKVDPTADPVGVTLEIDDESPY